MDQDSYLSLMQFPSEWLSWQMLPEDFLAAQAASYEPGHEDASEHDRHGVFQWWLRQQPDADVLVKLARLSWLDPDQLMAQSVRNLIAQQPCNDSDVSYALSNPYRRA